MEARSRMHSEGRLCLLGNNRCESDCGFTISLEHTSFLLLFMMTWQSGNIYGQFGISCAVLILLHSFLAFAVYCEER